MQKQTIRVAALAVGLFAAVFANSQIVANSYSGNIELNGNTYNGEEIGFGSIMRLYGDGTGSQVNIGSTVQPLNQFSQRSMLRFSAIGDPSGNPDFRLPSDRNGNSSSAASGESRVFNTWASDIFPYPNIHNFTASVYDDLGGANSYIDIEVQEAPRPTDHFNVGNEWMHELLDNSIYDQNNTIGAITINKNLTPVITLQYTLMSVSFHRGETIWADNSTSASLFRDDVYTGSWLVLSDSSHFYAGTANSIAVETFNVGEGDAMRTISSETVMMNWDISSVDLGVYDVRHWGIGWMQDGFDGDPGFGAFGTIHHETLEGQVHVVPEPMTLIGLTVGGIAFIKRRKR